MLHQQIAVARVHTMRSVVNEWSHYTEYGAVSTAPEKSTTAHIIMSINETDAKDILQNHGGGGGGVNGKDFTQLFNEESDADKIDLIYHSPYYSSSNMPNSNVYNDYLIGILSLNSQSILAKFHCIEALITKMKSQGIHFPVKCIQ